MPKTARAESKGHREYLHPPIVDAVIEVRYAEDLSDVDKIKLSTKFSAEYELMEQVVAQKISVEVNPQTVSTSASVIDRIIKRTKLDQPHVVQIGTRVFNVGTLAPYEGWTVLFERFQRDWKEARRYCKKRTIERIGVRYINRLDLKPNDEGRVDYEDYLNLRINLPPEFPPIFDYELTFRSSHERTGCGVTVRSGIAPPAIPGRASFLLDIDVWKDSDVPQKESAVYELLMGMRKEKNDLFETFITNNARELFNAS